MEFASYIELFYNSRKWEWCAVSYFSAFQGISPLISSSKRALSPPPSPSLLGEAPSPPFLRYGVSHLSLSGTLPFTANEKDPSASLGMTIREERVFHTLFLCMMHEISIPYTVISCAARNLFRFPPPSLSRLWEAPPTAFPAIRCFPFFAIGHSPSCRQRKRSLDDDTGNVLSQHNLFPIYGNAHFPPFY